MEPPTTQPLPIFRYFVHFPDTPGHWQEVNKKEYAVLLECMYLSDKADPRSEGVRVVRIPRDLYQPPCFIPAGSAMLALMLLPPILPPFNPPGL